MKGSGEYSAKQHCNLTGVSTALHCHYKVFCLITREQLLNSLTSLSALAQMVACLPLVQQVWGSIPGGVVNSNLNIFNLGARRGGDVHFLIARLYITVLD